MKEKITIYTSETCAYCDQVKEVLKENKLDFVEKSHIDFKKEWDEIIDLLGANMLPTILYKDFYFSPGRDYQSPQDLANVLENFESKEKYSIEHKILERLKTLNYSIHLAFRTTDSILRSIENKLTILTTKDQENEHKSTS
jgi:glutaredoxin